MVTVKGTVRAVSTRRESSPAIIAKLKEIADDNQFELPKNDSQDKGALGRKSVQLSFEEETGDTNWLGFLQKLCERAPMLGLLIMGTVFYNGSLNGTKQAGSVMISNSQMTVTGPILAARGLNEGNGEAGAAPESEASVSVAGVADNGNRTGDAAGDGAAAAQGAAGHETGWNPGASSEERLYFAKVRESGRIPVRKDPGVGFPLYGDFGENDLAVYANQTKRIPTAIAAGVPEDFYLTMEEYGTFSQNGLQVHTGIIDSGDRGEIFIEVTNKNQGPVVFSHGHKKAERVNNILFCPADLPVARLVIHRHPYLRTQEVSLEALQQS